MYHWCVWNLILEHTSIVKDDNVNSWRPLSLTIDVYFNIKLHTRQMYGFPTLYKEPKGLTLASTVILLIQTIRF